MLSLVHRPFLKLLSFTVAGAVMSASGQAPNSKTNELTNAQQKGPLIPEAFIDVPSQRLYVVSLWLLCQVSPPCLVFNIRGGELFYDYRPSKCLTGCIASFLLTSLRT